MIPFLNNTILKRYKGKTCLLRVDLNISFKDESGLFRLESIIPTIQLLLKHRIKVVLVSHRGHPPIGGLMAEDKRFSLKSFAPLIEHRIKKEVAFMKDSDVKILKKKILESKSSVILLENVRFFKGEESNNLHFANELSTLADFYVNDAFAVSHRSHASVSSITHYIPSYAGPLMKMEIEHLDGAIKKTKHPFVVVIGGAKISDKLNIMKYFWNNADRFLLGGGPANTLFKIQGFPIEKSLVDFNTSSEMKKYAASSKTRLPSDVVFSKGRILDIGRKTREQYAKILSLARTIVWNGPMGLFERRQFAEGTETVWRAILGNRKARIIIGGGETIASSNLIPGFKKNLRHHKNIFISTGGSAMLDYLSGKKLPGIEALKKNWK